MHKHRPTEYAARKAAHADAKAKDAATPQNVPQLRELVSAIMAAIGMK